MHKITFLLLFFIQFSFSQTINYPESFVLQENEIPQDYKIKIINQEIIDKGFLGNPGFLSDELMQRAFYKSQLPFFSKVYVAVYINEKTNNEIVVTAFKLNKINTYFNQEQNRGFLLIKDDVLVSLSDIYNTTALDEVKNNLIKRTGLQLITQYKDLDNIILETSKSNTVTKKENQSTNTAKAKNTQFIGSIDKKVYGIITLNDQEKSGYFLNIETGESIFIAGTIEDGVFKFMEFEKIDNTNRIAGYFEGKIQEKKLVGEWISPNRKTKVPFDFKKVDNLYKDINSFFTDLPKQVMKIEKSIQNKDWNAFISYCNQEHYNIQTGTEVGLSTDTYIYENLGISINNKTLKEMEIEDVPGEMLSGIVINNMENVKIDKVEIDNLYFNFLKFSGTFTFQKRIFTFSFYLTKEYQIIGGLG